MPVAPLKITTEGVRTRVKEFWKVFCEKKAEEMRKFYDLSSTAFSVPSPRTDPGQLTAMRRAREYFHEEATLNVEPGLIDVALLGDAGASANYTFRFDVTKRALSPDKKADRQIPSVRATQVFRLSPEGALLIVQEHFSVAVQK